MLRNTNATPPVCTPPTPTFGSIPIGTIFTDGLGRYAGQYIKLNKERSSNCQLIHGPGQCIDEDRPTMGTETPDTPVSIIRLPDGSTPKPQKPEAEGIPFSSLKWGQCFTVLPSGLGMVFMKTDTVTQNGRTRNCIDLADGQTMHHGDHSLCYLVNGTITWDKQP